MHTALLPRPLRATGRDAPNGSAPLPVTRGPRGGNARVGAPEAGSLPWDPEQASAAGSASPSRVAMVLGHRGLSAERPTPAKVPRACAAARGAASPRFQIQGPTPQSPPCQDPFCPMGHAARPFLSDPTKKLDVAMGPPVTGTGRQCSPALWPPFSITNLHVGTPLGAKAVYRGDAERDSRERGRAPSLEGASSSRPQPERFLAERVPSGVSVARSFFRAAKAELVKRAQARAAGDSATGPRPMFPRNRCKLGPVLSFRDPSKGWFPQDRAMEGGSLHAPLEALRPVIPQGTANIEGGDVLRGQGWTTEAGSAGRGRLVLPGLVDAPSDRTCRTQEVQIRIGPGCLRAWPWGGGCVYVWGGKPGFSPFSPN